MKSLNKLFTEINKRNEQTLNEQQVCVLPVLNAKDLNPVISRLLNEMLNKKALDGTLYFANPDDIEDIPADFQEKLADANIRLVGHVGTHLSPYEAVEKIKNNLAREYEDERKTYLAERNEPSALEHLTQK